MPILAFIATNQQLLQ